MRSMLPLEERPLSWFIEDVDGDTLSDLLFPIVNEEGRWLHIHKMRPGGAYPATPDSVIEIKKDIVSWGVGDFRPEEAGAELLFTTRNAAYTLSPRIEGYAGNVRKIATTQMLLDLAATRALPSWPVIGDLDGLNKDITDIWLWKPKLKVDQFIEDPDDPSDGKSRWIR